MDLRVIWEQYDSLLQKPEPVFDKYSHYFCSSCGGPKVFEHAELPVCGQCGLMDFQYISDEAEWMSGIDNDGTVNDGSRCGEPVNTGFFSESWNMGTKISTYSHSTYADKKMSRIHFHNSMNHKDRALFHAYEEIERICAVLKCSKVISDTAKLLYKEFNEKKLTRGDVRAGIKANCIFLACKQFNVPRTTKEIADAFNIDTKDIGRTSSMLSDVTVQHASTITMPKDIIPRILTALKIEDGRFKCKCVKLCEKIQKHKNLMGKTPSGIAAAVIYLILDDKKQDICKSAGISIPTMNKMERTIREIVNELN